MEIFTLSHWPQAVLGWGHIHSLIGPESYSGWGYKQLDWPRKIPLSDWSEASMDGVKW